MTISLEMVVPGLVGYWLDQKLGTKAILTVVGFGLGTTLGIWHLVQIGNTTTGIVSRIAARVTKRRGCHGKLDGN